MSNLVKIRISDFIYLDVSQLDPRIVGEIKSLFLYRNPTYYKNLKLGFRNKSVLRNLKSFYTNKQDLLITRGGLDKLVDFLLENKIEHELQYKDLTLNKINIKDKIVLRDYQQSALNPFIEAKQGLIVGVCGSGKTEIALKLISEIKQPALVIVHTKDLMYQWIDRINKRLLIKDVSKYGAGYFEIGNLTIGMLQTIKKRVDKLKDKFGFVILDECHHSPAEVFHLVINQFPARYRLGLTATPKRKDQKEFLMFDTFGPILYEIKDEHLLENNLIHNIEINLIKTDFEYNYDKAEYVYFISNLVKDKNRNLLILKYILQELKDSNSCLILSDRVAHCKAFYNYLTSKGFKVGLMIGEIDKLERKEILDKMRNKKLQCLIGTNLADEGLDIPNLNRLFILTPSAMNDRKIVQQTGRIKRIYEGKKDAIVYYFWDHLIFPEHLNKLKKLFSGQINEVK